MRWDDITAYRVLAVVLDFEASAVEVRRAAPRLLVGRGRQCLVDGPIRLQLGDVAPSLAVLESMATWISEPGHRAEIGTDAAIARLIWRPEPASE